MKRNFSFWLLIVLGVTIAIFNSYGKDDADSNKSADSLTYDKGVIINGVKWATRNVASPGTFADKPEDAGMYYQWNSKKAWAIDNPTGCLLMGGRFRNPPGWDRLVSEDSAWVRANKDDDWERANDPSPVGWRVPALAEIQTLFDSEHVDNEWTTENGVTGIKFTDKFTGNTLFLRAAGFRAHDGKNCGEGGYYWSSTSGYETYLSLYFDNRGGGRNSERSRGGIVSINSNGVVEWLDDGKGSSIYSIRSVAE